jgi:UDP:flavonoid glycosyltransferase YjiC (YdhE family)
MRILFTSHPGFGHLHPLFPLASAARDAGHEVAIASGPEFADRVRASGFPFWPVGLTGAETVRLYLERHPGSQALPAEERVRMATPRMFVEIAARSRVAPLLARSRRWRPDLVVHEQSELAAPVVAAVLGVPSVVHGWGPMLPASLIEVAEPALDVLARRFGVTEIAARVAESPYVDICPPGLQPPGPAPWARVVPMRGTEPVLRPEPSRFDSLPFDRTIYVTLGTVVNDAPGVLEKLLAGVSGLRVNVVMTVGPDVDPGRLGPAQRHVVLERYVPQELVLPHCAAVVAHAGAGTMMGALAHGLPQVLVPLGAEQHLNAEACRRAGAALVLDPGALAPADVGAAVRRALADRSLARAAGSLAAEIAALPTPADVLAQLLRNARSACSVDGKASSSQGSSRRAKARTSVASSVVHGG